MTRQEWFRVRLNFELSTSCLGMSPQNWFILTITCLDW